MKILAFDTSTTVCTVGLLHEGQIHVLDQPSPMKHGQLILPMIDQLLTAHSLSPPNLDAVAFGAGPGSLTGIRIAMSVGQTLGLVNKLPLIPLSSMAALAQAAFFETQHTHWQVALDAHLQQIYWASYWINEQQEATLVSAEKVINPMNVTLEPNNPRVAWRAVGNGWEKYAAILLPRLKQTPSDVPLKQTVTANALLHLAAQKFKRREWLSFDEALPNYLR